jgi:effector-binding domain-containing protein
VEPVRIVDLDAAPTAVVRATTTWDEFPGLWGSLLDEVWAVLRQGGVAAGRNVMLYTSDRPDVEIGVELLGPFAAAGRVVASTLPAGRAAQVAVPGPVTATSLAQGHDAVIRFCEEHGRRRSGVRLEVYGHVGADGDVQETTISWLLG